MTKLSTGWAPCCAGSESYEVRRAAMRNEHAAAHGEENNPTMPNFGKALGRERE